MWLMRAMAFSELGVRFFLGLQNFDKNCKKRDFAKLDNPSSGELGKIRNFCVVKIGIFLKLRKNGEFFRRKKIPGSGIKIGMR